MTKEEIKNYSNSQYLKSFETNLALVGIRKDGIIEIKHKIDDYDVEVADQIEIADALAKLTNNGSELFSVIVIPGLYGSITKEARDYEIFEKDSFKNLISLGIVVHALHQRILANFFLKFKMVKPSYPTKIFDSPDAALEWTLGQRVM